MLANPLGGQCCGQFAAPAAYAPPEPAGPRPNLLQKWSLGAYPDGMRRVLGLGRLLLVVALLGAILVGAVVAGVFLTHPRDEEGYVEYVRTHGDYDGHRARTTATDETLIAAGDRACDWLKTRRPALWRTDRAHRINDLYRVLEKTRSRKDRALPAAVVPGAWKHLCPAYKTLIEPHRPWQTTD